MSKSVVKEYDLVCVGGGIMSASLALITKILDPSLKVLILERLEKVALESSAAWNNAGTGHSALCELNYTPENKSGSVDISKAVRICKQFEVSKQFWSFLTERGLIKDPRQFVKKVPHHSWVNGKDNVDFMRKRFDSMHDHFMFNCMEFTEDHEKMKEWFPLIMEDRTNNDVMAASRIERGTEVNYGALTETLFTILEEEYDTPVRCNEEVLDIDPDVDLDWTVVTKNNVTKEVEHIDARHVFIGAGGGSLLLLQKVEIDEKDGYGGFPVSGQWLVCKNEDIIKQHNAKVYSKAGPNDPPMSTPHLDTRFVDGKKELLFGPFAGFSPKFLKEGSYLDLLKSLEFQNMPSMFGAFWHNLPLTKYLIQQVTMSFKDRMNELRKFMKNARDEDWEIVEAGQRVQIIKKDDYEGGKLQFGTEVVSSDDGKITCLLGASPGASTAVSIVLDVIDKAFPEIMHTKEGEQKLKEMVPFWRNEANEAEFEENLSYCRRLLNLT